MTSKNLITEKQKELLSIFRHGKLKRINILCGAVRSGKTWISLVLWALWVSTMPRDGTFLMVGKTLTSLKRNCLDLLCDLVGDKYFTYSLSKKEGRLFGRLIYLEGVNDARSESKIRGMTLQGAYCDELTLFAKDFFIMLLSRLSMKGAKLIGTTNPDSPTHWLKEEYIDKKDELDLFDMNFTLQDNTFLEKDYIDNLMKEYTGVYYDRFVLGKWKRAEGVIFGDLADNPTKHIATRKSLSTGFKWCEMAYDLGGNGSDYGLCATAESNDGIIYVLKARKIKSKDLKAADVENACIKFINEVEEMYGVHIGNCLIDDSYYTTINGLNEWRYMFGNAAKIKAKMPLYDRPLVLSKLLAAGRLKFVEGECGDLIETMSNMVYDDKADKAIPLDDGTIKIDLYDALCYSLASNWFYLMR